MEEVKQNAFFALVFGFKLRQFIAVTNLATV